MVLPLHQSSVRQWRVPWRHGKGAGRGASRSYGPPLKPKPGCVKTVYGLLARDPDASTFLKAANQTGALPIEVKKMCRGWLDQILDTVDYCLMLKGQCMGC